MLYFAYGSNISTHRMQARIPSAMAGYTGYVPDRKLVCNKLGADGSGKANLIPRPGWTTYGILYELSPDALQVLDAFETGYRRVEIRVFLQGQAGVCAQMYVAQQLTDDPVAFDWYRAYIVAGAREHGFPATYIRYLEQLPVRSKMPGYQPVAGNRHA